MWGFVNSFPHFSTHDVFKVHPCITCYSYYTPFSLHSMDRSHYPLNQLIRHLVLFTFLAIRQNAAINIHAHVLCNIYLSLGGTYLGVVLLSHMLTMLMLLMSCLRRVCQKSQRFTPKLSSKSFMLLSLTFRSMIRSDLIFMLWCEVRKDPTSFFCM